MTVEPAQARASREPGSLAEAASAPGTLGMDSSPPLTGPYTEHDPCHDPLVMFAHLAGSTERIRLATGVLVLPQRQTALVARQAPMSASCPGPAAAGRRSRLEWGEPPLSDPGRIVDITARIDGRQFLGGLISEYRKHRGRPKVLPSGYERDWYGDRLSERD